MDFDRRNFLTGCTALGFAPACRVFRSTGQGSAPTIASTSSKKILLQPTTEPHQGIRASTISQASAIFDVQFSPEEQALMLDSIDEQIEQIKSLRGMVWDHELSPATHFDPRLPGRKATKNFTLPTWNFDSTLKLPARDEDIAFASISELASWIATGKLSSLRLTELYLSRLREFGDKLECVITLMTDHAIEEAKKVDRKISQGQYWGPLHGIPWGAKDLLSTVDAPTTWGAEPYKNQILIRDAIVVDRLRQAGAVLIAKLSLGALAYGDVWFHGKTKNPWYLGEGSHGSSAGSAAAVAAGLVGFSIGSETFGSILSPCMRCGATGLRPTFGRVPRTGAMPLCWSLDKIGPIARRASDTGLILHTITGPDIGDPDSIMLSESTNDTRKLAEIRVGYIPSHFSHNHAQELDRISLRAIQELGITTQALSLPKYPYDALETIIKVEAAAAFEELSLNNRDSLLRRQDKDAWPNLFRSARFISAIDYLQAQRLRRKIMHDFAEMFDKVDLIVSPTFAEPMSLVTNFTGHPALVIPVGTHERKPVFEQGNKTQNNSVSNIVAPHGVTLWGRLFDESTLVRVAQALEDKLAPQPLRPPFVKKY